MFPPQRVLSFDQLLFLSKLVGVRLCAPLATPPPPCVCIRSKRCVMPAAWVMGPWESDPMQRKPQPQEVRQDLPLMSHLMPEDTFCRYNGPCCPVLVLFRALLKHVRSFRLGLSRVALPQRWPSLKHSTRPCASLDCVSHSLHGRTPAAATPPLGHRTCPDFCPPMRPSRVCEGGA